MPISPTLPTDGQSDWDVPLNAAIDEIVDAVNAQESDIAGKLDSSAAPELIRDTMGTALVAGTNVTITPNDGADTITISASPGGGATDLDSLSDVTISSVADNQVLQYDSGTSLWKNETLPTTPDASTTVKGIVELATSAETTTGTDTVRATTPAGVKAVADTLAPLTHNHAASDINSGTIATARLGSGTANSGTYLRGDQSYAALPSASDTAQGIVELATTAEATTGTDTARAVTAAGVAAVVAATRARYSAINAQTGTTYAPVLGDESQLVTLSNASSITVTMPSDATTAFPTGATIDFVVIGAGMATFSAGSGATVNPTSVTRAQWSAVTAIKRASNTWLIVGDIA